MDSPKTALADFSGKPVGAWGDLRPLIDPIVELAEFDERFLSDAKSG
jgi:hypothetical protein